MYYDKNTYVFHKGDFIKAEKATMNLYSQSLHYGNGVFEGIRSYKTEEGPKIFKAKEHFERLQYGCKIMDIPFNYTCEELERICYELLQINDLENAYIRPIVNAGTNMSLQSAEESTLTIQCWAWEKYMGNNLLRVKTSPYKRPHPESCHVAAKVTGHYINSILSTNDAKKSGYDECLLLDHTNHVAESSGGNVFMQKDGKLYTPTKGSIMPGITRQTVLELCTELNIEVKEKAFNLNELKNADGAFFTGTAAEIAGIQSLDDYTFPLEWEESFGHTLSRAYLQLVKNKRITISTGI